MPRRENFRHQERLRVRWAEVDMQKIVFNGHYLMYADTAVAGYWRALAMPYHDTMQVLQGDLYVRKATLEYAGSARYDELLQVGIRCARIGNSSLTFETAICRADTVLVHGELVYVFADPATMTSKPVPDTLRALFTAFEAGEAMVAVTIETWPQAAAVSRGLRQQVLVDELQLPPDLVEDADDNTALHAVARNRFGVVVGTGRLLVGADGQAQLGRMAVLASVRGAGVGRVLFGALLQQAKGSHGCTVLNLHASAGAEGFYAREGCSAVGAPFDHAGVRHQTMQRRLVM